MLYTVMTSLLYIVRSSLMVTKNLQEFLEIFPFSIHAVAVFVVTVSVSDMLPSLAYAVITA